jgi:hypothetical protein
VPRIRIKIMIMSRIRGEKGTKSLAKALKIKP